MGQAWDAVTEAMAGVRALGLPGPVAEAIEQLLRFYSKGAPLLPLAPTPTPKMPVDIGRVARLMHKRAIARAELLGDLLADGAWHMLLELTAEEARGRKVSVSSLCIASALPPTTALRHIKAMEDRKLIERHPDRLDGRRVWVELTEQARSIMQRAVSEYAAGAPEPADRPRSSQIHAVPGAASQN